MSIRVNTGYYGVTYIRKSDKYQARVKAAYLGSFESPAQAAFAVNEYIIKANLDLPLNHIPAHKLAILRAKRTMKVREQIMRNKKIINHAKGPEDIIQEAIIDMLEKKGWFVKHLHGNMYQRGFPDLFAARKGMIRLIEVKNPKVWKFEETQIELFGELAKQQIGVWIMFAATEEEYAKLFKPANYCWLTKALK